MEAQNVTPINLEAHVGKQLRAARLAKGLSQGDLADAIGVTFQQIQKYESGLNRISAGKLYRFSLILKEPLHYFFSDLDEKLI